MTEQTLTESSDRCPTMSNIDDSVCHADALIEVDRHIMVTSPEPWEVHKALSTTNCITEVCALWVPNNLAQNLLYVTLWCVLYTLC